MRAWEQVLRGWRQPGPTRVPWGAGGVLLALLALSPALARAETIAGTTTTIASGNVGAPAFQAPLLAWVDGTTGDVVYYDVSDGSTHNIGPGSQPAVGNGQIVFICGADQNVCAYNPATQQTTTMTSDSNDYAPGLSSAILAWIHVASTNGYGYVQVMDLSTGQSVSLPDSAIDLSVNGSLVLYETQSGSPAQGLGLYDQSTGSFVSIGGGSDGIGPWGLDGTHVVYSYQGGCAVCNPVTNVEDLSGNIIASIQGVFGASISGDWVPFITQDNNGTSQLSLWQWTTGDVFSTNAPPPEGTDGIPTAPIIGGTQVVELGSSNSIDSFVFSSTGSSTVSFSDSFASCTSTTNLGSTWSVQGTWYCNDGRARGESTSDLALANAPETTNTSVSALVQLDDGDDKSGVAVRVQGDNYYAARLRSSNFVELIRVNSGVVQVLASYATTISQEVSYTLGLSVTGTALTVTLNGKQVLSYTDSNSASLSSGFAGLLHGIGYRTQYANFVLTGSAPTFGGSAPTVTSFSDDFAQCTSTGIGPDWTVTGTWYCEESGQARGQTAGGLALANANLPANQTVMARVELSEGGTGSGLVARASNGNFYLARMLASGSFELDRVVGGTITPLGSAPQTFTDSGSYRITLSVSQSAPVQLTGSVNGTVLIKTTDSSAGQLTSGSVGMYSGSAVRTQYYEFSATSP